MYTIDWFLFYFVISFMYGVEGEFLEVAKKCVPTAQAHGPCHMCVCSLEGIYQCENKCSDDNKFPWKPNPRSDKGTNDCEPQAIYRNETLFCTCSPEGDWKSHTCEQTFQSIWKIGTKHKITGLRTAKTCTPNNLYLSDCNICTCNRHGRFDSLACTDRRCSNTSKADKCVHGEFLNTGTELCACTNINYYIDRLCIPIFRQPLQEIDKKALGSILTKTVGKSWRRRSLLDVNEKCLPGESIKVDCNKCICSESGVLLCTSKLCLSDAQDKKLFGQYDFEEVPVVATNQRI